MTRWLPEIVIINPVEVFAAGTLLGLILAARFL